MVFKQQPMTMSWLNRLPWMIQPGQASVGMSPSLEAGAQRFRRSCSGQTWWGRRLSRLKRTGKTQRKGHHHKLKRRRKHLMMTTTMISRKMLPEVMAMINWRSWERHWIRRTKKLSSTLRKNL
jgi:hypothetical protein